MTANQILLANTLRAIARGDLRVEWDDWYPIVQVCADDPKTLTEAVRELGDEECYALLDTLKADGGPLADYLLLTLAAHPDAVGDDQVRAYLLSDSTAALERRQRLLADLLDRLQTAVGELAERTRSGFDLAAEIALLEQQRNSLTADQLESGYSQMVDLEWQIARLELAHSRLAGYAAGTRQEHCAELLAETDRLRTQGRKAAERIKAATLSRDQTRAHLDSLRAQEQSIAAELADARAQEAALTGQVDALTGQIASAQQRLAGITPQAAALAERHQQLEASLRAQESRLDELRSSPVEAAANRVREQIRKLYRQLPSDDAEPMFTAQPRRSTR